MRILDGLQHAAINVVYLHILPRDRVPDGSPVLSPCPLLLFVLLHLTRGFLVLLEIGVDLGITLLLLTVQPLHELLNVGDAIGAGVGLPRWDHCLLGVHLALGVHLVRMCSGCECGRDETASTKDGWDGPWLLCLPMLFRPGGPHRRSQVTQVHRQCRERNERLFCTERTRRCVVEEEKGEIVSLLPSELISLTFSFLLLTFSFSFFSDRHQSHRLTSKSAPSQNQIAWSFCGKTPFTHEELNARAGCCTMSCPLS